MSVETSVCELFLVAIEHNNDLNLVESGANVNFKLRIFSFSSGCYQRIETAGSW